MYRSADTTSFSRRELRLHFGVTTDLSPVAPEDQVFDKVDLLAWTVGLSGRLDKLTYAAASTTEVARPTTSP
jgi:hypothetical protein